MSISSIFGSPILLTPRPSSFAPVNVEINSNPVIGTRYGGCTGGRGGLMIECSSRPTKKATAHHRKTRPRKTQPWDIKRKPTVYDPLPPMPPDFTLVSSAADEGDGGGAEAPALEAPVPVLS